MESPGPRVPRYCSSAAPKLTAQLNVSFSGEYRSFAPNRPGRSPLMFRRVRSSLLSSTGPAALRHVIMEIARHQLAQMPCRVLALADGMSAIRIGHHRKRLVVTD